MSRKFHIAVLECDTPVPAVKNTRGSYGEIFESLLKKGLQELNPPHNIAPVVTKWDVVASQEYPNLHEVDAILISGSSKFQSNFYNNFFFEPDTYLYE
jgi:GMP synthase (glutamine-hydrolysing)